MMSHPNLIYYHYLYKAGDGKFYREKAIATKEIEQFIEEYKKHWDRHRNCKLLRVWNINTKSRKFERVRVYLK